MPDKAFEPIWLSAANIERINRLVVAKTGEKHALLSSHLLESAVARPKALFDYEGVADIVVLGVRLMEAIGKNHCFVQGNKRTAFQAGLSFMELNDAFFDLPDTEENAELAEKIIIGAAPADDLVALLRQRRT